MNGVAAAYLTMHLIVHSVGAKPQAQTAVLSSPPPVTTTVANTHPTPQGEQALVNLVSAQIDLPAALRVLSVQSKIGLVLLSSTDQKLTTNLVNTPFKDALDFVCKSSGLMYLKVK